MFQAKRHFGALMAAAVAGSICLAPGVRATAATLTSLPPVIGLTELFAPDGRSGVALSGFDPVTYFLTEGPQPGRPEHEIIWSGVAWRFASAANREAFEADPETYAPRIGGYDASAAADGRLVAGEATLFTIRNERLYLFRDGRSRARFEADPSLAGKAEARWLDLQRNLVRH
jgi:hypothetical protein